jgi:MOSC domain-containing protein YiiM
MSTEHVGKVLQLFISVKDANGLTQTIEQNEISLDEHGVLNDKFYTKDPMRSILISSLESYTLAKENNISMPFGSLGENILMDFNPYSFHPGDQLKIGNVILEITQNCTLCKGLSKVDTKAPKLLKNHRGIFAKTVTSGNLKIADKVYIQ